MNSAVTIFVVVYAIEYLYTADDFLSFTLYLALKALVTNGESSSH